METVLEIIQQKTELVIGAGGEQTVLEINEPRLEILTVGIQGPSGVLQYVANEVLTGAINGSNASFLSAFDFQPESVCVFVNGLAQRKIADFNTSGTRSIIFVESPEVNDSIFINYLRG